MPVLLHLRLRLRLRVQVASSDLGEALRVAGLQQYAPAVCAALALTVAELRESFSSPSGRAALQREVDRMVPETAVRYAAVRAKLLARLLELVSAGAG